MKKKQNIFTFYLKPATYSSVLFISYTCRSHKIPVSLQLNPVSVLYWMTYKSFFSRATYI